VNFPLTHTANPSGPEEDNLYSEIAAKLKAANPEIWHIDQTAGHTYGTAKDPKWGPGHITYAANITADNEAAAMKVWAGKVDEARKLAASERAKVHGFVPRVWPDLKPASQKKA
jgi:hypothetical protein